MGQARPPNKNDRMKGEAMCNKLILVGMVLLGAASGAVGGEGEKEAVAAIEKLGWKVKRSSDQADAPVVQVLVTQRNIQGADLKHLAAFKELEALVFFTVRVEGEGLTHLSGLKKLRTLSLG